MSTNSQELVDISDWDGYTRKEREGGQLYQTRHSWPISYQAH